MKQYIKKEEKCTFTLKNFCTSLCCKTGFTLVETMVAVMMVMLVVSAVTFAVRTSVIISAEAKYNMEAQALAKEAMEYVRNVRDTQILKYKDDSDVDDWLGDLDDNCSQFCAIDLSNPSMNFNNSSVCVDGKCPVMRYDTSLKRYGYGYTGELTPYTREVTISTPAGGVVDNETLEALVVVCVSWEGRTGKKQVEYQQSLFNWIKD